MTDVLSALKGYNVLGPTLGSIITSIIVIFVARYYTIRTKTIDSTFEFSKRFHDLLIQQQVLNKEYDDLPVNDLKRADKRVADVWWLRFFDLMLFEYEFFKQGLLMKERFEDWMKWRWHEFHGTQNYINIAWGMGYREGWDRLERAAEGQGSPFIGFLHDVHHATDVNEVKRIVKEAYSSGWRKVRRRLAAVILLPILILLISLMFLWHETATLGGRLRDLEIRRDRFAGQLSLVDYEMANQYLAVAGDRNGSQKLDSLQRALNYEREAINIRPTDVDARDNMKSSCVVIFFKKSLAS